MEGAGSTCMLAIVLYVWCFEEPSVMHLSAFIIMVIKFKGLQEVIPTDPGVGEYAYGGIRFVKVCSSSLCDKWWLLHY